MNPIVQMVEEAVIELGYQGVKALVRWETRTSSGGVVGAGQAFRTVQAGRGW